MKRLEFRVQRPESSFHGPASRIQRPGSSVESAASSSCVQSPGISVCPFDGLPSSLALLASTGLAQTLTRFPIPAAFTLMQTLSTNIKRNWPTEIRSRSFNKKGNSSSNFLSSNISV